MASIDSGVETGNESNDSPVALDTHTTDRHRDGNGLCLLPPLPVSEESSMIYPIFSPRAAPIQLDFNCSSNVSENSNFRDTILDIESHKRKEFPNRFRLDSRPFLPMIEDKSSSSCSNTPSVSSTSHLKLISEEYANDPLDKLCMKTDIMKFRRADISPLQCAYRSGKSHKRVYAAFTQRNNVRREGRMEKVRLSMRKRTNALVPMHWSYDFSGEKKPQIRSLFSAAQLNDVDRVHDLLLSGVSPNCFDSQNRTPLHLAACKGYAEVVKLLLLFRADPDIRDGVGNTALHLAVCTNHLEVVSLLLKAGIDVSSSDFKGRSPLQLAQSKLKILQRSQDIENIKSQVIQVIDMLMSFINKNKNSLAEDLDFLTSFQYKFKISDSAEQVGTDIKDLLAKLDDLSVSTGSNSSNS